jgi:hypothetical protein
LNRHHDLNTAFENGRGLDPDVNPRYEGALDQPQSPAGNQPADPTAG